MHREAVGVCGCSFVLIDLRGAGLDHPACLHISQKKGTGPVGWRMRTDSLKGAELPEW